MWKTLKIEKRSREIDPRWRIYSYNNCSLMYLKPRWYQIMRLIKLLISLSYFRLTAKPKYYFDTKMNEEIAELLRKEISK